MERSTKQFRKRNAILACLCGTKQHPSAEWIFNQLKPEYPDLSLGTVYRNLTLFKQQGLIVSLGVVGGVERFDGCTVPHVHFVCQCCGRIQDLHQVQIPTELSAQAERQSCGRITQCQLSFYGTCQDCTPVENSQLC